MITVEEKSKINKKVLGIIGLIVLGVLALAVGFVSGLKEDSKKEKKESYDKCIKLSDTAYTGAIFTMDFSEVKKVIGRNLSVGDLNSSTGGWQLIYSGSDMKEYGIGSSSGIWEINIITDLDDNVIGVACKTVGLNNGKPNDTEIDSFTNVFSEILEKTHNSIKSILIDLSKSGNSYYYQDGIILRYVISNGFCEFIIMAATEEFVAGNGTNNGNGETGVTSSVKIPTITDSEDNETTANQENGMPQEETTVNQNTEKPQENTTKKETTTKKEPIIEEQTTSEKEIEQQTNNQVIKLADFKDYNNVLQKESSNKYRVQFDNEVFDMWIDNYTTSLSEYLPNCMWSDENVVIRQDLQTNYPDTNIYIYAFDDIYLSNKTMTEGAHKVSIRLKCTSSSAYRCDVKNTKELYDFILTLAQRMKEKYPVDKGISISEFTDYDAVINEGSNSKYRVQFDNEVFDMWIDSYTTELTEYLPDCMWNEDNVVIKQDFSMNSNIGIHIFAFDEIYESDKLMNAGAKKIYIEFRCASSSAYRYDVENTKEMYDFILTLAQRMKEKYPVNN